MVTELLIVMTTLKKKNILGQYFKKKKILSLSNDKTRQGASSYEFH